MRKEAQTTGPDHRPTGKPWTFAAAAEFLNISVKHLRYLADVGQVTPVRIGLRKLLIPDFEVRRIAREGVTDAR